MTPSVPRLRIGMRTVKTVAAVIIAIVIVGLFGTTDSKLIFAMLGAMAAVQPTFKDSLESCLTQFAGVFFGAVVSVLLLMLPVHPLVSSGIGIMTVIVLYNLLGIRYSPALACMIVVSMCYETDARPIVYAAGRIWDSSIGLAIGMAINTLVFPYDNSRQIRQAIETLDKEVIEFLENMFDGDDQIPDAGEMTATINEMGRQLATFSNQRLILRLRRQKAQLESFRKCEGKSRELLARMEVLSRMERPGRLNEENRRQLAACGADIRDTRPLDSVLERDVVTNYHVRQILRLRRELLDALKRT